MRELIAGELARENSGSAKILTEDLGLLVLVGLLVHRLEELGIDVWGLNRLEVQIIPI